MGSDKCHEQQLSAVCRMQCRSSAQCRSQEVSSPSKSLVRCSTAVQESCSQTRQRNIVCMSKSPYSSRAVPPSVVRSVASQCEQTAPLLTGLAEQQVLDSVQVTTYLQHHFCQLKQAGRRARQRICLPAAEGTLSTLYHLAGGAGDALHPPAARQPAAAHARPGHSGGATEPRACRRAPSDYTKPPALMVTGGHECGKLARGPTAWSCVAQFGVCAVRRTATCMSSGGTLQPASSSSSPAVLSSACYRV